MSDEKKERVIHTRVSETMAEDLKERAGALGISVSNLVRNALLNTFGFVEDVIADSANVARSARGEARAAAPGAAPGPVIGWQELVLNMNAICARCNAIMAKGSGAAIGLVRGGGHGDMICTTCLKEVRDGDSNDG